MRKLLCFLATVLPLLAVAEAGAAGFVALDTITGSDVATLDEFGGRFSNETAVSTDGSTLLVAAWQADCPAGPNCGAAYVFVRTPGGWVQQAKLTGPDTAPGDGLSRVALSGDGNVALVGADFADCGAGSSCGAAYSFVRNGTVWSFHQKLTPSDVAAGNRFGGAVSLSADGNTALVAASNAPCGMVFGCGAVYVFTRSGGLWTQQQKLTGDPDSNNAFGALVEISADGQTALITGDAHGGLIAGRVYVFTRSGNVWSFQEKLAPLGSPFTFGFGMDLSADGNVALVHEESSFGGPDVVYVFTRTGTAWSLETRIPDPSSGIGVRSKLALSDDGQTAAIKSQRICNGLTNVCQAAHVFHRNQGTWSLVQTLTVPNFTDIFANGSVDLSGDGTIVLIADPGASCASGPSCGVVHVFGTLSPLEDVPTVSELGLVLLALLLAASGARVLARGRRSA